LQGSNEETDIENRLMDIGRGEERVIYWKEVSALSRGLFLSRWYF